MPFQYKDIQILNVTHNDYIGIRVSFRLNDTNFHIVIKKNSEFFDHIYDDVRHHVEYHYLAVHDPCFFCRKKTNELVCPVLSSYTNEIREYILNHPSVRFETLF